MSERVEERIKRKGRGKRGEERWRENKLITLFRKCLANVNN